MAELYPRPVSESLLTGKGPLGLQTIWDRVHFLRTSKHIQYKNIITEDDVVVIIPELKTLDATKINKNVFIKS